MANIVCPAHFEGFPQRKMPIEVGCKAPSQSVKGNAISVLQAARTASLPGATVMASKSALPLPTELINQAIEDASDESGWAHLGAVGNLLTKLRPDFDPRLYGSKKLSDLLKKHSTLFTLEERGSAGVATKTLFVRAIAKTE